MQAQPIDLPQFVVRPDYVASATRLFTTQVECFDVDGECGERALSVMFAGLAESVRAGRSIYYEFSFEPYGSPMSREILNAIEHTITRQVSEDGDSVLDWRYLSDLTALAADIEAVGA